MSPQPKKKRPQDQIMGPPPMMGADPSQPIADSSGQYRSVAGPNPSPSMSVAPKPMPQVSVAADTIARRMASRAQNQSAAEQLANSNPTPKKKRSLMDIFLEMNS